MEDHVPRHAQMGAWVLINDRWYYSAPPFSDLLLGAAHLFEQAHDYAELVPIDPKPSH